jgi:SOS response regulatory protein OraA/RecX
VLDRLESAGLQSDSRCAEAILRTAENRGWSRRRTLKKMADEGIAAEVIEQIGGLDEETDRRRATELYEKLLPSADASRAVKRRILGRVARRGFAVAHLFDR